MGLFKGTVSMFSRRKKINTNFFLILTTFVVFACGGGAGDNLNLGGDWLIPKRQVVDGGPGLDGIPALENPVFESTATITTVDLNDIVSVVRHDGQIKVYPHDIMNYHEIVNDGPAEDPFVFSYCPLTDSAMAWKGIASHTDSTFGVSGLLYNANLILYDRETFTFWSQMLQIGINGSRIRERPAQMQVIETKYSTLLAMYPDAVVLTRVTGHSRDYDTDPYGPYSTDGYLIFQVSPMDNRLFPKARIIGIYSGDESKTYQLAGFGPTTQVINDQFQGQSIVVVGNSDLNFSAIYNRQMSDGTILNFSPLQNDLPNVLSDDEGNVWDIFGTAVSGPRAGTQLGLTRSYKAMWFAWAAFFKDPQIYFN